MIFPWNTKVPCIHLSQAYVFHSNLSHWVYSCSSANIRHLATSPRKPSLAIPSCPLWLPWGLCWPPCCPFTCLCFPSFLASHPPFLPSFHSFLNYTDYCLKFRRLEAWSVLSKDLGYDSSLLLLSIWWIPAFLALKMLYSNLPLSFTRLLSVCIRWTAMKSYSNTVQGWFCSFLATNLLYIFFLTITYLGEWENHGLEIQNFKNPTIIWFIILSWASE